MRRYCAFLLCVLPVICGRCEAIEPFTMMATAAAVGIFGAVWKWSGISCSYTECCTDSYISLDAKGLHRSLSRRVYGQHLVIPTVFKAIKGHINDKNPPKPLVLSFHGWTGGGKNYVSNIIIKNLYKKGERSLYVHTFNSDIHFKHPHKVSEYKDQLQKWVYHNVSSCGRSIFIFDEMDHMPEGMIDVLIPFLGHSTHMDGVDFRKAIFIFISNTGGDNITNTVLQHHLAGKPREDIKLRDMQTILQLGAYYQENGLKGASLVSRNLIDHFIPFLPLERNHVKGCIIDEFERQNIEWMEHHVNEVLNELQWFPKGIEIYSEYGCKKIKAKMDLLEIY